MVAIEKMELGSSDGKGEKCSFLLHVTKIILDVRSLKDWIQILKKGNCIENV